MSSLTVNSLVRIFDDNYAEIAEMTRGSCSDFCRASGLELNEIRASKLGTMPYMRKVSEIARILKLFELHQMYGDTGRALVYADVDISFVAGASLGQIKLERPLMISADNYGLCSGFMVIDPTAAGVRRLFDVVEKLGYLTEKRPKGEQSVIKLLHQHFSWVRDLIGLIPDSDISNPESSQRGRIAHHFWANGGKRYVDKRDGPHVTTPCPVA